MLTNKLLFLLKLNFYFSGDVLFLKEFHKTMHPVSQALDILQSEEKAYLGMLLPTIAMCLKRLRDMKESKNIKICLPLLNALVQGIEIRFSLQTEDNDCRLAAAFHPQFKLH